MAFLISLQINLQRAHLFIEAGGFIAGEALIRSVHDFNSAPEKERTGLLYALRALRHRNYRLFFGGQSISLIGTWMTRIATSWLIYRLTGSALLLGLVSFAGQLPTFLFAPFAGVWVDRLNRHRVLVVTQMLAMLQSLSLAVLALAKIITVPEIIWLGAFQGLINAFGMPARQGYGLLYDGVCRDGAVRQPSRRRPRQ